MCIVTNSQSALTVAFTCKITSVFCSGNAGTDILLILFAVNVRRLY